MQAHGGSSPPFRSILTFQVILQKKCLQMTPDTNQIKLLPESVVEKIAAGEVIERPASVIKELVENAIDGNASKIEINVEDAGFSLIRIFDNGYGMGPSDLQRCFLRHATSKINNINDLFSIATLGFRGEALASIAAVSRFSISSSPDKGGLGYSISRESGSTSKLEPCQHVKGTTVVCRDLFYNVPARKKFMKSKKAEKMAFLRLIEQIVIPFPAIHFTAISDGKPVFDFPSVDNPISRIAQVAGTEFAGDLIQCSADRDGFAVTLFISSPDNAKPRPRFQNLYVNLRRIDSDSVIYGIRESFSRFISSHLKPSWFCFLEIDPSRVDVNIHPTKQRIKFDDEKALFRFIYRTVYESLSGRILVVGNDKNEGREPVGRPTTDRYSSCQDSEKSSQRLMERSDKDTFYNAKYVTQTPQSVQTTLSLMSVMSKEDKKGLDYIGTDKVELPKEEWDVIPCFQIHKMFILASIKKGILLIDQHAAHERVLYEQALENLKGGRCDSQRLLFPVILEFSQTEKSVIFSGREYFNSLGFDVQDFGGASVAVSGIPAVGLIKERNIEEALRDMVDSIIEEKNPQLLSEPQKRFAAAFACGAAIKAGDALRQEEMVSLLNSLFAAENPYICPHGRPTIIRISLEELTRRFLR